MGSVDEALRHETMANWDDGPPPVRIKFGPGKTQDVPVEWASSMLAGLLERNPNLFRDLLFKAGQEAKLCPPGVRQQGKETGCSGQTSAPSGAARVPPRRGGGRNGESTRSARGGEAVNHGGNGPGKGAR
jgi:hypothetical protein